MLFDVRRMNKFGTRDEIQPKCHHYWNLQIAGRRFIPRDSIVKQDGGINEPTVETVHNEKTPNQGSKWLCQEIRHEVVPFSLLDVVCAPPSIYVQYTREKLRKDAEIAVQNCYKVASGAFTGEVRWIAILVFFVLIFPSLSLCTKKNVQILHSGANLEIFVTNWIDNDNSNYKDDSQFFFSE